MEREMKITFGGIVWGAFAFHKEVIVEYKPIVDARDK